MSALRTWLEAQGLGNYAAAFEAEQLDFEHLPDLDEADLKSLGLPMGPRKTLRKAIEAGIAAPAASGTRDAERRQITVMFCDLVGSTALSEALDPEELREIMRAYQKAAGGVIERYEGHVAQYLGDGLMTYFGWPRAHEDDAERAVRASLDIVAAVHEIEAEKPLAVRIGIATGPVVVGETGAGDASVPNAAVGETPNLAARLQSLAGSDEIVISPSTRHLVGDAFALDSLGDQALKGIAEAVTAWRVEGLASGRSRFEASRGSRLTPFVGRQSEVSLILDKWAIAQDGEGQVVLLSGEPGIGKSRITEELIRATASDDLIRLRYQCSPFHANSVLYPIIEQFERAARFTREDSVDDRLDKMEALLGDSGDAAESAPFVAAMLSLESDRYAAIDMSPERQAQRLREILSKQVSGLARQRPVLFIFEDAHWIDHSTEEVLDLTISHARDHNLLMVITFRPEYQPRWLGGGDVTALSLTRLGRRQAAAMVARVSGGKALPDAVLDQIVAETDGVPLFVEELTKTVLESGQLSEHEDRWELSGSLPELAIPATLQDSLMARLDRLAPVKEIAQLGACIGRVFSHRLLEAVSPVKGEELSEALARLVESELVFRRGSGPEAIYTFKHALVQDAAHGSLLISRRREFHGRIASALEDAGDAEPELLAYHYGAADDIAHAVPLWHQAGAAAAARAANPEAVAHFRKGLDVAEGWQDEAARIRWQLAIGVDLAMTLRTLDRYDEALDLLDWAEGIAADHNEPAERGRVHYSRGNVYFALGKVEGLQEEHEKALAYAVEGGSKEMEARAYSGLGDAAYAAGGMATAHDYFKRCVALCEREGFEEIAASNIHMVGWTAIYLNRPDQAQASARAGVALSQRLSAHRPHILSETLTGYVAVERGRNEEGRAALERALALSQRAGASSFDAQAAAMVARQAWFAGDGETVRKYAERSIAAQRVSAMPFFGPYCLGVAALVADDPAEADALLGEAEAALDDGCVSHNYFWFMREAVEIYARRGDWDQVERHADRLEAYTRPEPLPWCELQIARARALAAHARAPSDATRATLSAIRDRCVAAELATALPAIDRVLGG
jgi:class 3 adenylate cyclase/tetratricopeptide (TPR) repeat protein